MVGGDKEHVAYFPSCIWDCWLILLIFLGCMYLVMFLFPITNIYVVKLLIFFPAVFFVKVITTNQ